MAYTKKDLQNTVKDILGDRLLVIVSNREPYVHVVREGKIECKSDRLCIKTGNVYIETESRGKVSGIYNTDSKNKKEALKKKLQKYKETQEDYLKRYFLIAIFPSYPSALRPVHPGQKVSPVP